MEVKIVKFMNKVPGGNPFTGRSATQHICSRRAEHRRFHHRIAEEWNPLSDGIVPHLLWSFHQL